MSYADRPTRIQTLLHRKGISRRLNSCYERGGWTSTYVETVLPSMRLALAAARWETRRLVSRERVGRWCWRWTFAADRTGAAR